MDADSNKSNRTSAVEVGCIAFAIGAVAGFFVAFVWSNSQVHTTRFGHIVQGSDHRAFLVIGDVFLGAIVGGSVATVIALIWRLINKERRALREPPVEK
jgi:hypothetical protein